MSSFLGFDFDPDSAVQQCRHWLENADDLCLEHVETQRASLEGMIKHPHLMTVGQGEALGKAEKILYDYLVENGAVSSPVLRDKALGGDLLHIPFDRESLT
jgi:hypothetical protein